MLIIYPPASTSSDSSNSAIIGAVVAALVGALVGAFLTYLTGEKARMSQKRTDEIRELRLKIRAHQRALKTAESELEAFISLIFKNLRHYREMEKGITDLSGGFYATLSMPQSYLHQPNVGLDLIGTSFALKWESYENEVVLQNSNLNEFNAYYSSLRSSAHEILLRGGTPNPQVIAIDDATIRDAAKQCIVATESFKERCFDLMAELALSGMQWENKMDFTTVSLEEVKDYMDKLQDYKPTEEELKKYIDEQMKPNYTDKMHKSASQIGK